MGRMYDSWAVCVLKSMRGWKQLSPLPLPPHLQRDINNGIRVKRERLHAPRRLPLGWDLIEPSFTLCLLTSHQPWFYPAHSKDYNSLHLGSFSFGCDCGFRKDHLIDFLCTFVTFAELHLPVRCLLFVAKLYCWLFLAVYCSQQRAVWTPRSFHSAHWSRPIITCRLQLPSSVFFVVLEGASSNAAANTPVAQLPEILLHFKEQTLHCFWPNNLLLELIKMCETSPLLCKH